MTNMREILYKALVLDEDIGELTQDLTQPERDEIEYSYCAAKALSDSWVPCAATPEGIAIGVHGAVALSENGNLQPIQPETGK